MVGVLLSYYYAIGPARFCALPSFVKIIIGVFYYYYHKPQPATQQTSTNYPVIS